MSEKITHKKGNSRLMVHVYLTYQEKKRIEEEEKKLGISVSSYIKVKLFSEK